MRRRNGREEYKREKHLAARKRYKFVTLRFPLDEHAALKSLVQKGDFPSINEAIGTYITWGLEQSKQA